MFKYKSVLGTFEGKKYQTKKVNAFEEALEPTPEYTEYKHLVKMEYLLTRASIPISMLDYDLNRDYIGKSSIDKINYYVENFEDTFSDKCLYLYGDRGTQKTTVAYWIGIELLRKDISTKYITMKELIDTLVNEQFSEEAQEEIVSLKNTQTLILDRAFDKEQVTIYKSGYQLSFLDSFLRNRLENDMKATIIISNNEYTEIANQGFNPDIEDLIKRSVKPFKLVLEFKDHYTLKDDFEIEDLWKK